MSRCDLATAGYKEVPVEKLIATRMRGIDADFVRSANRTRNRCLSPFPSFRRCGGEIRRTVSLLADSLLRQWTARRARNPALVRRVTAIPATGRHL